VRRKGKKNRECRSNQKPKKHPVKNVTFLIITSFFQNSFLSFSRENKNWEKEGKRSEFKRHDWSPCYPFFNSLLSPKSFLAVPFYLIHKPLILRGKEKGEGG